MVTYCNLFHNWNFDAKIDMGLKLRKKFHNLEPKLLGSLSQNNFKYMSVGINIGQGKISDRKI
jgi:hypothetical protein